MTPTLSPAAAGAAQCALLLLAPPALLRGSLLPEAPTLPWGLRSPQAAKGTPSHLPAAYASCATRCAWFGHARSGCKRRARGFPRTGPHASCARPNGRRSQPAASARRCATASGARAGPAAWSVVPRLRRPRPRPRRRPLRPWPGSRRRARTPAPPDAGAPPPDPALALVVLDAAAAPTPRRTVLLAQLVGCAPCAPARPRCASALPFHSTAQILRTLAVVGVK